MLAYHGKLGLRIRWGLMIVLLCGGVSACAVRFVYNQLDWAIPWYLKDYMALNGDQKNRFQQRLDDYLYWHRVEQLPLYADFLRKVADEARDGLDRNEISVVQKQTEEFADVLVTRMIPQVVALFASASDKQLRQLFERFEADNERFRRDNIDISERAQRKQAVNDARDYVERWIGGLSDKQERILRHWGLTYQPMGNDLLEARLAWQQAFRDILALRRRQPQQYEEQLTALLKNRQFGRSAAFNRKIEHNGDALISLYQTLDESLSADQRQRLIKSLHGYAEDFTALARQATPKEKRHG